MNQSSNQANELSGQLIDTWWYGLTRRLSEKSFRDLAELRVDQGFTAVQLVAGIPPEVGPEHPDAASEVGPAWTLAGDFNEDYLKLAAARIALLNDLGLRVVVYGAWGHQISWLGTAKMIGWWEALINHLDRLDVIYCLTGESNLWIGQESILLPNRSTTDLWQPRARRLATLPIAGRAYNLLRRMRRFLPKPRPPDPAERKAAWTAVLASVRQITGRPLIIHTNAGETSEEVVSNPELLAAHTTQTGHSQQTRALLWSVPLRETQNAPERPFINLEPWYEGINGDFYAADQIYAYWATMLAGAASCCYGAHGIWNAGDGVFLGHWGHQTMGEAMHLDTPRLLGLSHAELLRRWPRDEARVQTRESELLAITRQGTPATVSFYPDIARVEPSASGDIWLPLEARYVPELPASGPVVLFS